MKDLNVVFENSRLLVVDKPAGLVVNRAKTIHEETLQDILAKYLKLGNNLGVGDRAGIVHRLDRETSGLLIVAKDEESFLDLQAQFKNREVAKEYQALVHGKTDEEGSINGNIGRVGKFGKFGVTQSGKASQTFFEKISTLKLVDSTFRKVAHKTDLNKQRLRYLEKHALDYSLLRLFPKTGRTHQIRVHLKHIGHPVVSDTIYTPGKLLKFDLLWCSRLFLHAKMISFRNIETGKIVSFESQLPRDLEEALGNF